MTTPIRLMCVAGARPNFVKLAPLFRAFASTPEIAPILVHTGQHQDDCMSGRFLRELALPLPRYSLGAGPGSQVQQTAVIMQRLEPVLMAERPSAVLVVGDVNSTLAAALAAKKLGFFLIHAEAGLRSFDRSMPEEINRLIVDAISDLNLVSEDSGMRNLAAEGVPPEKVRLVGDLMVDCLLSHLDEAKQSRIVEELGLHGRRFGVVTLHRPGNVDHNGQLGEILRALRDISTELPLVFPVHPRTAAKLPERVCGPNIHVCEPLGYLDFLCLTSNSAVMLTDSGGVQEETSVLGIPCLTLRNNTERPATVEQGTNRLAGTTYESILRAWRQPRDAARVADLPAVWDGHAAERCVEAICDRLTGVEKRTRTAIG